MLIPPAAINALLPLFLDNASSVAMIRHSMDIVKAAIQHLNPGQTPVLAADQPLYARAKEIQWTWPATHGEDHFVIMFGGLHIEMATLKLLGDWLEDSGWTNALVQADIASSGTANSIIHASHITKTRHAHQVTAASLYTLLQQAYSEDCTSDDTNAMQLVSLAGRVSIMSVVIGGTREGLYHECSNWGHCVSPSTKIGLCYGV